MGHSRVVYRKTASDGLTREWLHSGPGGVAERRNDSRLQKAYPFGERAQWYAADLEYDTLEFLHNYASSCMPIWSTKTSRHELIRS